jgi:alanine racemase
MHRQGILIEEIDDALEIINANKNINLEGICSHFSDSDNTDPEFTKQQISNWNNVVSKLETQYPQIKYFHISNTYGHKYLDSIKSNTSRLGIGLYGIADNLDIDIDLKPVLEMKTIITGIKKIKQGQTVGYSNTFVAQKDMTIATVPIGYFEGLDRRLSNKGFFAVNKQDFLCPIIGRVSMNITTIDISGISNPKIGDEVIVISNDSNNKNSIQGIAKIVETIPYEVVVYIPEHLKRVVVE